MDRFPPAAGALSQPAGPPRYLPYRPARTQPNIVVDSAPLPSTQLALSHWPNNQSPPALRRDTSTATVFAWLDASGHTGPHAGVPFVTSNHFDEDGLFSMFAVIDPVRALAHRSLLTGGALAGDFGVVRSRAGARLCFVIEAFADPARSPLPPELFEREDRVAALYEAMLPRLPSLLADLDQHRDLWGEEDEHLEGSRQLIRAGAVTIEEDPEFDLAVVRLPPTIAARPFNRYLQQESAAVHPFAINTATARSRVVRIQGRRYSLEYRYESWVRLATRRVALRVALDGLRARLDDIDPAGPGWHADDPTDIVPRLYRQSGHDADGRSGLEPDAFIAEVRKALATAPVVWDPYDWQPTTGWVR